MRTTKKQTVMAFLAILMLITTGQKLLAQHFKLDNETSNITIYGTSSLHDWDETVREQSGNIAFKDFEQATISNLNISVVSESLKSYKSGMDKNTYKALRTDEYKTIDFRMLELIKIKELSAGTYQVDVKGELTITGSTKIIELPFKLWLSSNKITIEGQKKLKMTDYGIEPPKALLGTIKTGNEITVKFKSIFKS